MSLTLRVPAQAAFSEHIWPRTPPTLQRPGNHFFRVTQAIHRRGVDPVDAQLEGAVDRGDRIVVILISPCELPSRAATCPRSKTHGSDAKIRISKLFGFHVTRRF